MTTALVVTYPVVEYDFTLCDFNSLSMEEKIRATQQKKENISAQLNTIAVRISQMSSTINKRNEHLLKRMAELRAEVEELQAEQRASICQTQEKHSSEDDDLDEMFREFDADQEKLCNEILENFVSKPAKDKRLTALFRKIARRTHPDKTKDPEIQALFIPARKYYEEDDLEGLQRIWEVLNGKKSSLLDLLLKRLEKELRELDEAERHLKAVKSSEDYQLLELYERNQLIVLASVERDLSMKISLFQQQRDNLRSSLGKSPVHTPETTWINFTF